MTTLPTTRTRGAVRPLGCLPPRPQPYNHFRHLDEVIPLADERAWKATNNSHLLWDLMDQDGQGACNACAATLALEGNREQQHCPRVKLSWGHLYGLINNQRDEGSILEDAHLALERYGVCDQDTVCTNCWQADQWPATWEDNAARHRMLETWRLPTFAHLATAALHGHFFDFGIPIGPTFTPDSNGVLPPWRGRIRGYHAMCGRGLSLIAGVWHIGAKNSWGPWGQDNSGLCWIPRSYFFNDVADAFTPRVTTYSKGPT